MSKKTGQVTETIRQKKSFTIDDMINHFSRRISEKPYNEYWAGLMQYDRAVVELCKKLKEEGRK